MPGPLRGLPSSKKRPNYHGNRSHLAPEKSDFRIFISLTASLNVTIIYPIHLVEADDRRSSGERSKERSLFKAVTSFHNLRVDLSSNDDDICFGEELRKFDLQKYRDHQ